MVNIVFEAIAALVLFLTIAVLIELVQSERDSRGLRSASSETSPKGATSRPNVESARRS